MMENHGKGKPAWIKEEKEILEPLWRRENQGEPEPLFMKVDQEEPESQIKDEQEEIEPYQVKKELESLRIKAKQEEIEPPQIKEEWAEPKPPQIKDEQEESGPPEIKVEHEPDPPEIKVEHEEADPLQIKNEQEVLCMGLEKEQLELKQQTDTFAVNTTFKESYHWEPDANREILVQISSKSQNQNREMSNYQDSGSSSDEELNQNKRCQKTRDPSDTVDNPTTKRRKTTHMNDNLSSCKVCGKLFARTYLTEHMRIHTATMSSTQSLREFIRERLTAAAEEIFTEVDKTIVHYEEELDRLRLLETKLKPPINLQRIEQIHH
ncbi:hypothetical protein ATANTOWER_016927 [Ataeniobius toweri]|uniref:C2H2-type domain-containing protein n=1 Tax=Ataeniobius toweri TaxID=208326 RepID=A0ABU7BZM0_9TELE|nr:hypothetical protein [Ataeniobius toweri]